MAGKIEIMETVLRDAHQCLVATRMRTEDMLPIAAELDAIGYWSLETWGGATFDATLRFLKEDPWERLRKLRKKLAQATGGDHFIETVWGRGYVLRDPDPRANIAEEAA